MKVQLKNTPKAGNATKLFTEIYWLLWKFNFLIFETEHSCEISPRFKFFFLNTNMSYVSEALIHIGCFARWLYENNEREKTGGQQLSSYFDWIKVKNLMLLSL